MLERCAKDYLDRYRLRQRGILQAAMLAGACFNDPKAAQEMFDGLMGELADPDDDASDEAWLTNPKATTNEQQLRQVLGTRAETLADIEERIKRRIHERANQHHD